jgi:mycothiol system anti-sigma-R factor
MRCDRVVKELSAFLDGELPAAATAELRAHLDGCSRCRADLESLRRVAEGVKALPRAPAPAELREQVMARIEESPAQERSHWRHWRTWWGAAAAIAIGLVIMFLYPAADSRGPERFVTARQTPSESGETAAARSVAADGSAAVVARAPTPTSGPEWRSYDGAKTLGAAEADEWRAPAAPATPLTGLDAAKTRDGVLLERKATARLHADAKDAEVPRDAYLFDGLAQSKPSASPATPAKAAPAPEDLRRAKGEARSPATLSATTPAGGVDARETSVRAKTDKDAAVAAQAGDGANVLAQDTLQVRVTELTLAAKDPVAARQQALALLSRRGVPAASVNEYNMDLDGNRARREEAVRTLSKSKETQAEAEGGAITLYLTPAQLTQFQADLAAAGLLKRSGSLMAAAPARGSQLAPADNSPPMQQNRALTQDPASGANYFARNDDLLRITPEGRVPVVLLFVRVTEAK